MPTILPNLFGSAYGMSVKLVVDIQGTTPELGLTELSLFLYYSCFSSERYYSCMYGRSAI